MTQIIPQDSCPCGRELTYAECCEPYHLGKCRPPDPESLMRARYSAFVAVDVDYLEKTMRGEAKQAIDRKGTRRWAGSVSWLGLEVLGSKVSPSGKKGTVEFIASYEEEGEKKSMQEKSIFRKHKGYWYYVGS